MEIGKGSSPFQAVDPEDYEKSRTQGMALQGIPKKITHHGSV
jgi:hypothetical protein